MKKPRIILKDIIVYYKTYEEPNKWHNFIISCSGSYPLIDELEKSIAVILKGKNIKTAIYLTNLNSRENERI